MSCHVENCQSCGKPLIRAKENPQIAVGVYQVITKICWHCYDRMKLAAIADSENEPRNSAHAQEATQ